MTDIANQIICGDCAEVMAQWPDEFIDLTVTSPPYDNLRTYNGYVFDFEKIAQQLYRITKKGGVFVWVVADATIDGSETGTSFKQALYFKEIGFKLHDTMIWQKQNYFPLTHNRYEQSFEYMFVFSKGKPSTFIPILKTNMWAGKSTAASTHRHNAKKLEKIHGADKPIKDSSIKPNVWTYISGYGNSTLDKDAFKHVATFPEQLANDHIISWSNEGDVILDPFIGSGTTAIAAIKTNRKFIGIDISQEYCELAKTRINRLLSQTTIDFGNNVDYEMIEAVS